MAHAPGRQAARLCSPPRLKPAEVAAVGVKLARVLAVVHARGVLHRDINASNASWCPDVGTADGGRRNDARPAMMAICEHTKYLAM